MNVKKLANLVALGTREEDVLDIMGIEQQELLTALTDPQVKQAIQEQKDEQYQTHNDINQGWDLVEQLGITNVIQTLQQNPDPSFALAAATQANKMRRREAGTGQIQPINAQQNNVVVVRLSQNFTDRINDRMPFAQEERQISSQGMPKDINTMTIRDAENALLPEETKAVEMFEEGEQMLGVTRAGR